MEGHVLGLCPHVNMNAVQRHLYSTDWGLASGLTQILSFASGLTQILSFAPGLTQILALGNTKIYQHVGIFCVR